MSNIKPLDNTEKTVTALAILGGLLFFFLLLTKCQGLNKFLPIDGDADLTSAIVADAAPGVGDDELANLRRENADAAASIDILQDDITDRDVEIEYLEDQLAIANNEIDDLESDAKKNALAVATPAPKEETIKKSIIPAPIPVPSGDTKKLKNQIKELEKQKGLLNDKYAAEEGKSKAKDAEIEELKKKIVTLNTERDSLKAKAINLEKAGNDTSASDAKLAEAEKKHGKEVADLKAKHTTDKAAVTDKLNKEIISLRNALRKEKAGTTFAKSSADLAPSAQRLISRLDSYKGAAPKDLDGLYNNIKKSEKSTRKIVVGFASGSSSVGPEDKAKIDDLLAKANPNAYFMAVGYASNVGSAASNKNLSSKRATGVANYLKPNLKENQFIQAYYLGQTDRFGEVEKNQIVEIWEISE